MNKPKLYKKTTSSFLAFLIIFQTVAGVFLPVEFSLESPYVEIQETNAAGENWYNASWTKRKAITVTENSGSDLTDYQIKITVPYDSDMQADFDDIRFTDENGSTLIDHWLESKTDSTTADFWVEIPMLTASSDRTIYMYYGNGSVASASNFDNTFTKDYSGESGLVGQWNMDEGSDNTCSGGEDACDSSGQGNHGTFKGDGEPAWVGSDGGQWDGRSDVQFSGGDSLSFDGVDDYVDCGNDASLNPDHITVEMWIYPEVPIDDYADLVSKFDTTRVYYGYIRNNRYMKYRFNESAVDYTLPSWNTWYHIAATYDEQYVKLYVNGDLKNSVEYSTPMAKSNDHTKIGYTSYYGNSENYKGFFDEVRIYNRALSQEEITAHYERRKYASSEPTVGTLSSEEYLDHLVITGNTTQTAGTSQAITITAKTNLGNTYTGYTGDKSITFSGANVSLNSTTPTCSDKNSADIDFGTATTLTFTNGVAICDLKLYKAESAEIEGTDGTYTTAGDANDLNITVSSAALNNFLIDAPSSGTGGTAFSATIISRDAYNNTTTTVSGDTTLSINQSGSILPATVADTEFTDDGIYTDNLTITNIEEQPVVTITATNGLSTGTDTITILGTPTAPTNAALSEITAASMKLTWTDNSSLETGFKIEQSTDNVTYAQIGTVLSNITEYSITSLDSYTQYYFRVRAYNTVGNSSYSTTNDTTLSSGGAFISPTPPTISLPQNQISVFEITGITENEATINLSNVQNAHQIAISATPDFKYVSWEPYEKNKTINILNTDKLYIKFRSKTGGVSEVMEVEIIENPESTETSVPEGSLVKVENDYKVYIKKGNYLRHIPNPTIFSFYNHFKWDDIKTITLEQFNRYQISTLIRELNDTKVYQIQDNDLTKHHLNITAEQFTDSGRSWDMVYIVNKRERDNYEMGEDVKE